MKVSISLTANAAATLDSVTAFSGSARSAVVEAAFNHFVTLPKPEQLRLIRESHSTKKAYTRSRWRTTFWAAMRDEFGITLKLRSPEREFAPHSYHGFDMVFLLNNETGPEVENDDFILHAFKNMHFGGGGADTSQMFYYPRSDSPFEAANKTANWIQNHMKMRYYVLLENDRVCCHDGHAAPEECSKHLSSDRSFRVVEADGNGRFTNARALVMQKANPGELAGHIIERIASPIAGQQVAAFYSQY